MTSFVTKHAQCITGVLQCFDRLVFHGHLQPIASPRGLAAHLVRLGIRVADFFRVGKLWQARLIGHAKATAGRARRPFVYLQTKQRKEDLVQRLLREHPTQGGLVCVLEAVEAFNSFRLIGRPEAPCVKPSRRKGAVLYYYYLDRDFGLIHVRLQTFAPFTIQICLNAHHWLARQMRRHRIRFQQHDNAFLWVGDPGRAQALADQFVRQDLITVFHHWASRANILLSDVLRDFEYYWVVDQAEYSTDVLFKERRILSPLFSRLALWAAVCLSPAALGSFLGKRLDTRFLGEVEGDLRRRFQGRRVKHRVNRNSIKAYDKAGSVLRVETTINDPADFHRRRYDPRTKTCRLYPLRKGLADFRRVEEIGRGANQRYLETLSHIDAPPTLGRDVLRCGQPVQNHGRRVGGFNLLDEATLRLFRAVLDGGHHLRGFMNRDVRPVLYGPPLDDPAENRRRAARVTRRLQKLRAHGLIAKIPRTRRWRVTDRGRAVMTHALLLSDQLVPEILAA